ncbi:MAG: RlpA-like double-psi beta-barrel domain-containing protein [Solirubrobacterales bacterium]
MRTTRYRRARALAPGRGVLVAGIIAATALVPAPGYAQDPFGDHSLGSRDLRAGDRGPDVKTLNWVLRSQALSTAYHGVFDGQTDWAVRTVQGGSGLPADGIVRRDTRKVIATRMLNQRATWYGPGFYGNRTGCGVKLTKRTVGVAHRRLPCGTRVAFAHRGRWVRARVIDRGPYRKGFKWDLTRRLAKRLGVIKAGSPIVKAGVAP